MITSREATPKSGRPQMLSERPFFQVADLTDFSHHARGEPVASDLNTKGSRFPALDTFSMQVYGSYLEVHYPAGALAGFGGAVGVSNLKEARIGTNLVWTPLRGFDIGAEFMYVHLNQTRPVGLAPDSTLTKTGLPAFQSNNNQYEGRVRIQRAF